MFCGIDVGSRMVKLAFCKGKKIKDFYTFDTAEFYRDCCEYTPGGLKLLPKDIFAHLSGLAACGYGKDCAKFLQANLYTELSAHAAGACLQTGRSDFLLFDLGGQDSKVILVKNQKLSDFLTGDRCAASTGRYLENMARVLNLQLDELEQYWLQPAEISSACAVFAETELIGKIARGIPKAQLAAGVNRSIIKRFTPLLKRLAEKNLVLVGGPAKSPALKKLLELEGFKVIVPQFPQHNAALGLLKLSGWLKKLN